jgi:hypothetical protein
VLILQSQQGLNDPSFLALYWADMLYIHFQFPIIWRSYIWSTLIPYVFFNFLLSGDRILDIRKCIIFNFLLSGNRIFGVHDRKRSTLVVGMLNDDDRKRSTFSRGYVERQ